MAVFCGADKMDHPVTHEPPTLSDSRNVNGQCNVNIVNRGDHNWTHAGADNRYNQGVVVNGGSANIIVHGKSFEILSKLLRAPAHYDSSLRKQAQPCMDKTRIAILDTIYEWTDSVDDTPIFWLYGPAGTGKSTIAHTIAEEYRKRRRLGASFFFAHAHAECSDPNLFFSTIAYQLSKSVPDLRQHIINGVSGHPSPQDASIPTQLEEFILTPMRKLSNSPARDPIIVVVDAFDECSDPRKATEILQLLSAKILSCPRRLKIFITSRPEPEIRSILHPDIHRISRSVDLLQGVDASSATEDIKRFLRYHLGGIGKEYDLQSWPREGDVETLAQQAGGLFIFAHTAMELIRDKDVMVPESQLAMFKGIGSNGSPVFNLNMLYSHILQKAIPDTVSTTVQERVITIIHSIVGLRAPLALYATERLLGFDPGAIRAALNRLRSIFIVPDKDEDTVQVIHPSFARYIRDEESCTEKRFFMGSRQLHSQLAKDCLKQMKNRLKQNICNFKDFAMVEAPIRDRADIGFQKLSAELRYSCENFAAHVLSADWQDGELCEMVAEWANQYLLYWLEVLALTGSIRDALPSLRLLVNFCEIAPTFLEPTILEYRHKPRNAAQPQSQFPGPLPKWLKAHTVAKMDLPLMNKTDTQVSPYHLLHAATQSKVVIVAPKQGPRLIESLRLLSDAIRMVSESYDDIKRFPHQIYTSCLAFCPLDSTLFKQYSQLSAVRVLSAERKTWGLILHAFKDPDGSVVSLTFSPDGTTLASRSSEGKILLWDLHTSESRLLTCHTLRHHTAFTFSPDGEFIAVDGNMYKVTTGEEVLISGVCSAFSANGQYIAVGCADGTIRLHDIPNLSLFGKLFAHRCSVTTLAFSSDNRFLASVSLNHTLRVWNCSSGEMMKQIHGLSGNITFSPNGTYVATCYKPHSLGKSFLWVANIQTDKEKSIEVDLGYFNNPMTVFSPSGRYIALGNAAELYVVEATREPSPLLKLQFNTSITFISFSPDEQSLLVANQQGMIRSWKFSKDEYSGLRLDFESKGHFGAVLAITFSHSGEYFASASIDGTICVWDFTDVDSSCQAFYCTPVLQQQTVIFAPDGQTVAIGSDNIVSKMDATTGYSIFRTQYTVDSQLIFSADGKYLAGNSLQELLCWDMGSSCKLNKRSTPWDTRNHVVAHVFSPNGVYYAVRFPNGDLWVHDLCNGESRQMRPSRMLHDGKLKFSHDSKHLALCFGDISMFDVEKGVQTDLNFFIRERVFDCAFSPCDQHIAIAHNNGLDILEYRAKRPITRKAHCQLGYLYVGFSPDGRYILAVTCWDSEEPRMDLFRPDTLRKLYTVKSWHGQHVDQPMREFIRTGRLLNHPLFQPCEYEDFPYLVDEDGWVITTSSKRLCRLPVANRGRIYDVNGNRIVVVSPQGKVTLIQFGPNPISIPCEVIV